jgi:hypothetical protein
VRVTDGVIETVIEGVSDTVTEILFDSVLEAVAVAVCAEETRKRSTTTATNARLIATYSLLIVTPVKVY